MNISLKLEKDNYDDASLYLKMLNIVNEKIDKELTGNDEYIEKINILNFKIDNFNGYMNVHATLVEDITR